MSENSQHSVSQWIAELKQGDEHAAQHLWERYCVRLGRLAHHHLRGAPRRVADEDDVVIEAFQHLCEGAQNGRFPRLADRDDLWQLLAVITERRAIDQIKHANRLRRGGGNVRGNSAFDAANDGFEVRGIEQVIDDGPSPEYAALLTDECRRLLDLLGDESLQQVALLKMGGYTNKEIAQKLGRVERSIERKVRGIRAIWEDELRR